MNRKMEPLEYDASKRQVLLRAGSCRADYFVEQAVLSYIAYGETDHLAWAIRHAIPEVMENDLARELLARLVEGKPVRKHGHKKHSRDIDAKKIAMFQEVWYFIGKGFPAYNNPESQAKGADACEMAAESLGTNKAAVYRVWKERGGRHPEGANMAVAIFYKLKGRANR